MLIVKIGGGRTINLPAIVEDLSQIEEPYVVVHGANHLRDKLADRLNIPKEVVTSISGYASVLSDQQTIDLQMMAYAGLRNKRLVEMCQRADINAVGLCGLDGRVIQGRRNRGIRVCREGKKILLRDFSGKPQAINRLFLDILQDNGFVPVLSVPIADEQGMAINSENDDIVALLHREYRAATIVHLIEAPGLLAKKDETASLIPRLTWRQLSQLEQRVEGRMRRKLLALINLAEQGPPRVCIGDGRIDHPLVKALAGRGTVIQ
jgi:acetylglutamate/LysW-gamma-L-alpha-aminoadipate kinase